METSWPNTVPAPGTRIDRRSSNSEKTRTLLHGPATYIYQRKKKTLKFPHFQSKNPQQREESTSNLVTRLQIFKTQASPIGASKTANVNVEDANNSAKRTRFNANLTLNQSCLRDPAPEQAAAQRPRFKKFRLKVYQLDGGTGRTGGIAESLRKRIGGEPGRQGMKT